MRTALVTLCQQYINGRLQTAQADLYNYLANQYLPTLSDAQELDAYKQLLYCYAGLGLDSLLTSDTGMYSTFYGNAQMLEASANTGDGTYHITISWMQIIS